MTGTECFRAALNILSETPVSQLEKRESSRRRNHPPIRMMSTP